MHLGWAWTASPFPLHLWPMVPAGWGVFGVISALVHLLFWAALIWLAFLLVRRASDRPRRSGALNILEERYARGEISREEFEERRAVLLGRDAAGHTPTPG